MPDINESIEGLGKAFEEFKKTHAQEVAELKKGIADVVTADKLKRIDDDLHRLSEAKEKAEREAQARIDEIEKRMNRPGGAGGRDMAAEAKELAQFNIERKSNAMAQGKPMPAADVSADDYRAYKAAFSAIMRKGNADMLSTEERKALQVGVDSDGGYLVPADMSGRIVVKVYESSPIRQIASAQTISTDTLEGLNDLDEAAAGGWVGEATTRSETNTPQIGRWAIPVHEQYASPKATQKIIDDAAVDIEAWLAGKVADKLVRYENAAFVTGNGVSKPRGFTDYTTAATADASRSWGQLEHIATGVNGDFPASNPADKLFDLVGAFKDAYLANARWVTRREVITKIRKFKESTTNGYLWQPGLQQGQPDQILGYPVTKAADMPTLATGSLSLSFGDFRAGYQIVDRIGIRVLRDPYTAKPYVIFYTTKRVGGGVLDFEAIKFLKFS